MENINEKIKLIVADVLELEPDSVSGDQHLFQQLGLDSIGALEIIAKIQKKFKIFIDDDDAVKMTSVGKICRIVEPLLEKNI